MNRLTMIAAGVMALAMAMPNVCIAEDEYLLGVVEPEYIVSPSPNRVYSSLPTEITLNITNDLPYFDVASRTVNLIGPDGNMLTSLYGMRLRINDTGVYKEVSCMIPKEYTTPGEYTFVIPEGSLEFPTESTEVSDGESPAPLAPNTTPYYIAGELRITYTVGEDTRPFTALPAEGDVDYFQSTTITFSGASSVALASGATATLSDRFGQENYSVNLTTVGDNMVLASLASGRLEVLGEHTLTIPAGALIVDGTATDSDMKLYYNIIGVEPVWTVSSSPAFGTIDMLTNPIILDFGSGMEVKHPFNIYYPAVLYMIDENGVRTQLQTINPRSEGGQYDEASGMLMSGTSKIRFDITSLAVPGEYELVVPKQTLTFNGKRMHDDMVFGRWVIEDTVGATYDYTVSPASGSVVNDLSVVDFEFSGITGFTWNSMGAAKVEVYVTPEGGERQRWTNIRYSKVGDTTLRVFINEYKWDPKPTGVYEVVLPAGNFTFTNEAGEEFYNRAIVSSYTLADPIEVYDGQMTVNAGASSTQFIVTFNPTPTTLEIYNDLQPVTIKGLVGDPIAASRVKLDGARAVITFTEMPTVQYVDVTIPAGYFLVDGKTSTASTTSFTMTGIDDVLVDEGACVDIYTLDGVLVTKGADGEALKALPAGLYVVGGKTVLVK